IPTVQLQHRERRLAAMPATEKVIVVAEDPDTRRAFGKPVSKGLRDSKLRLEGPAVGADVDEPVRVVLPGGCDHGKASTERPPGCALDEFGRSKGGAAQEIDRKPHAHIAHASAIDLIRCVEYLARDIPAGKRKHHADGCGASEQIEHLQVTSREDVDLRV